MKHNVIAWVLICFLASTSFLALHVKPSESSSQSSAIEWSETYGGTNLDSAMCVAQTSDEGYALTGYTMSFGVGGWDIWLIKTDVNGNEQWNKTYGGSPGSTRGDEGARWLIQTSDDGYALAGDTWSFAARLADFWLVKTDMNGNEQWNKTYDGKGWDGACSVLQTNEGGYAMVGFTAYGELGPDVDFWLVRTDINGNQLWAKTFGGAGEDYGRSFVQTSDGGYALAGWTNSFGAGGNDFWLVKTDVNGNQQWAKTYGGSSDDMGYSVVQTSDGGYAISGYTESFGAGCYLLIKTDSTGNQMWAKTYGSTIRDHPSSMIQTRDGGFAISGYTTIGAGDLDLWMVKTDAYGNQEWNTTLGGANSDVARCVIQTDDNGYALAGDTSSYGAGASDFWLVKLAGPSPRTWIVDDDDGPADFHTIQEAINAASDGDTIFVRNGTYYEHVIVNKTLSLVGESIESTIIDGSNNGYAVDVLAPNISISQFTMQNAGSSWSGVNVESSGTMIKNNLMIDNRGGVWVRPGSLNVTILNNTIFNKQPSYADGIRLFSTGSFVVGNTVINESTGIGLDWASNNTIQKNNVMNNYIGIGSSTITNNNTVIENSIIGNGYGFLIAMYDSIFYHNNIINNTVQAAFYSAYANSWNNTCEGNYWSDYNGPDENGDGIGDTPYVVDASNRDNYPLMNPYWNLADINHDLKIDVKDVYTVAKSYGTSLTGPNPEGYEWNPHCDINDDGKINMKDYYTVCRNYGKMYQ